MSGDRLCLVVTSSIGLRAFLLPHIKLLSGSYPVTVLVGEDLATLQADLPAGVRYRHVPIRREVRPLSDLLSLFRLYREFRRGQFSLVYTLSPKAGLLGMLAARLACVPRRVHCFTGQVWVTQTGPMRALLKALDRLTAYCATALLADSASQRQFLVDKGIVASPKIQVLGHGSMAGVDTGKFRPEPAVRNRLRGQLGLDERACCLLFVGRLKRDKGVLDLMSAFRRIKPDFPQLHLLLVGPDEEGLLPDFARQPDLHHVDYTPRVADYMAAADIFCLPSYREGFGQVIVEASAAGLPVVASRIYGITDAVDEGRTGLLHPPGDVDALSDSLCRLIRSPEQRRRLGEAGRLYASTRFSEKISTAALLGFIRVQLNYILKK